MEHAAQNEDIGAVQSGVADRGSATATDVRALLEREAQRLRRGRRLYLRLLLTYAGLACAFACFAVPTIYRHVHATSRQGSVSVLMTGPFAGIESGSGQVGHMRDDFHPETAVVASASPSAGPSQPGAIPLDWNQLLPDLPIVLGIALFGWFVLIGPPRRALRTQKRAAGTLAGLDHPEAVGPLAEALRIDDEPVRARAEEALVRLLPRLRAADAERLTNEQHACLNRALKGRNVRLILAILHAYEQVGDGRDLPHVEALARQGEAGAGDPRVYAAAHECLPFLELRARSQRAAQTLLRAAGSPGAPDATLLRAAHGTPTGDETVLLRPTEVDGPGPYRG